MQCQGVVNNLKTGYELLNSKKMKDNTHLTEPAYFIHITLKICIKLSF